MAVVLSLASTVGETGWVASSDETSMVLDEMSAPLVEADRWSLSAMAKRKRGELGAKRDVHELLQV